MSVPGEASVFSRFALKFIEVMAAGIATAFSGYIVAHLGGYLGTPAPTAVPMPAAIESSAPTSGVSAPMPAVSRPAQPVPAAAADAKPQRPTAQQDASKPAEPPARASANAASTASRKAAAETGATETKPRETTEVKSRDVASKPNTFDSLEARVRAALARGEAGRDKASPADASSSPSPRYQAPVQADIRPAPRNLEPPPRGADAPTGTIASAPRAADLAPPPPGTALAPPPAPLAPPPVVDIKSLPVAPVSIVPPGGAEPQQPQVNPQDSARASAQGDSQTPKVDLFAAFKKLPSLFRDDKPLPDDQAPRPPMPVNGE